MKSCRLSIGVDFHEWDGIFQGSRNHVLGIYRHAIMQAPDVEFVFFLESVDSLRASYREFRRANVRLVYMSRRHGLIRLACQLPWLCWREKVDVLHTQYRVPFLSVGPTVCTIHDVLFETHPQFFSHWFAREAHAMFRMAARRAHVLFTVSNYSKQEIIRHYGVTPEKIQVTYNGVDRCRFFPGSDGRECVEALGLTPGNFILMVGRLEPRKNHETLIKAWARLGDLAPPLVIVGQDDPNFPQLQDLINEVASGQRVIQFKHMGDDVLPAVMRHATVFAYPAFAEGFGMPVAEAMASGVPVITSNVTSLPEVAGDGAVLCDPYDEEDLYRALRQVLTMSETERAKLVELAMEQVQRFDWNCSAGILVAGLKAAATQHRGAI